MRKFAAVVGLIATVAGVPASAQNSPSSDDAHLAVRDRVVREIRRGESSHQPRLRDLRIVAGPLAPVLARDVAPAEQSSRCCWTTVEALRPEQWIVVELVARQRVRGRVISVDDDAVTLAPATGGGARRIERAQIVSVKAEPSKRMVIAGFVAVAGAGLLIASLASTPEEALPGKFWLAGMPLAIGGTVVLMKEKARTGSIYK